MSHIILIFVLIVIINFVSGNYYIVLCEKAGFEGYCMSALIKKKDCLTLSKKYWATSIHTNGACLRVFDGYNCEGNSILLRPGSPSHSNLRFLGFDKKTVSISECYPNDIYVSKYITLCNDNNLEGDCKLITVDKDECSNFKEKERVNSLSTNNACIRLYEEFDCKGRFMFFRPGSPNHSNLKELGLNNKMGSIGECQLEDTKVANFVTLCSESEKKGDCEFLSINKRECRNLGRKVVNSVNTHGTCLRFYEEENCTGNSMFFRPGSPSHSNLKEIGFNKPVASIGECILEDYNGDKFLTLCDDIELNGECFLVTYGKEQCVDLPKKKWGNSAHTHGACVKIFDEESCGGNFQLLKPGSPDHFNFRRLNFSNKASSISNCEE